MANTKVTSAVIADGAITPSKIASGDFYFDTDTLYIDSANNRVGVGTSSPSSGKLHVYSGNAHNNVYINTGTSAGWDATLNINSGTSGGNSTINLGYDGDADNAQIARDSSGSLVCKTNNTERMRINSSGIITTPSQPFFMTNLSAGNQTFANVAWVDLDWTGEPYDIGNNYVLSSGVFTAPVAGVYLFTGLIGFDTITATNYVLTRMTCSSAGDFYTTHEQKRDGGGTYGYDHAISQMVYLAASETVKMQVFAGSGGNHTIGNRSNWQGRLLG